MDRHIDRMVRGSTLSPWWALFGLVAGASMAFLLMWVTNNWARILN